MPPSFKPVSCVFTCCCGHGWAIVDLSRVSGHHDRRILLDPLHRSAVGIELQCNDCLRWHKLGRIVVPSVLGGTSVDFPISPVRHSC
jgi:hypothetical protein